jgi:hypothetical protein
MQATDPVAIFFNHGGEGNILRQSQKAPCNMAYQYQHSRLSLRSVQ